MKKNKLCGMFLVLLGLVYQDGLWAEPSYPVNIRLNSIDTIKVSSVSHDMHEYGGTDVASYSRALLLTLEEPVECDSKAYFNNLIHTSDKVIFLPAQPYASNYNIDNAKIYYTNYYIKESDQAHVAGTALLVSALANRTPVSVFHLEATKADFSYQGSSVSNIPVCFLKAKDFSIAAPLSGLSEGVIVNEGGQVPDPVQTNWGFNISTAGDYQLFAHWVVAKNTISGVSYDFDNAGTPTTVSIKQSFGSGVWVELGDVRAFTAGQHTVQLTIDQNGVYVVDGIKVEKVD